MLDAHRLLIAFVEAFGERREFVTFGLKGGPNGYVHIVPHGLDPRKQASRHLLVELSNGTVGVTEQLRATLGAEPRIAVPITQHPLGHSSGPNFGRFKYGVAFKDAEKWRGGLKGFVQAACKGLDELKAAHMTTVSDPDEEDDP